ncbi:transglycosylase SLT domain-containing protein [Arcobacter caeni]|uniref:Lytic transglycosylase n=1 Tax=Arcobacter caeni TaxID=1912877 RepID=A0A363CX35_9BACT|nr:transglycosylase SLT domain-containing protein [Arcobacter caeni]PUE63648.1 lytic transglycosylase [Arcobacter caeni]
MHKFFILLLFLVNTLFANVSEDDLKILKDLGIESSFITEKSLLATFDEYSSSYNINYYNNLLKKSSLNVQIVKNEIQNENLPDAVFFIPLLEASFVNQERGKNSPAGLWQIMPLTAKNLRLRNDESIDERLDLIKSTDAASSYLKKYYKKLDKWYLAILAYNSGEGNVAEGVARASLDRYLELNPNMNDTPSIRNYKKMLSDYRITKTGFSNLYDVYSRFESSYSLEYLVKNNKENKYLAESSITYMRKLIAFSMIANRDLFKSIDKKAKYTLEKVKAPKGIQLRSLANAVNMDYNEFRNLNKHIKKETLPIDSKSYNIYIPQNKLELYNQRIVTIKPIKENIIDTKVVENKKTKNENIKQNKITEIKKTNKPIIYIIKKGDSFESISKKYKVDLKKLKNDNNKKSNLIKIGDKIEIYK